MSFTLLKSLSYFLPVLFLCGCSAIWLTDFKGKGAKTKCLYLTADSLTIRCECDQKRISSITIREVNDSSRVMNNSGFEDTFFTSAHEYVFIAGRDSLVDSYYREGIDPPDKKFYPVRWNFFEIIFEEPVTLYRLPIHRNAITDKHLEIELHLTDSHWRETYYIDIKPKILNEETKIYSRYFSH